MNSLKHKLKRRSARQQRIRATVSGTKDRPRLSVFVSLRNVSAQLIDDENHKTVVYATTVGQKKLPASLTDRAAYVGEEIANLAKKAKIKEVVFDRNGRLYHGRVKALADAARKLGLEF